VNGLGHVVEHATAYASRELQSAMAPLQAAAGRMLNSLLSLIVAEVPWNFGFFVPEKSNLPSWVVYLKQFGFSNPFEGV